MASSVILLLVFASSIAVATFIESEQGTELARKLVYNSIWFEVLLFALIVNLLGSVAKYGILNKRKFSILLFHLAFIVIIVGAGITRYFGSEGIMHIREGETSNEISTDKSSVAIIAEYQGIKTEKTIETSLNENTIGRFNEEIEVAGKTIRISHESFVPNSIETIVPDSKGEPALSLFVMNSQNQSTDFILQQAEINTVYNTTFAFEDSTGTDEIQFYIDQDQLYFKTLIPLAVMGMMDKKQTMILPGSTNRAIQKTIYKSENIIFVLKSYLPNARTNIVRKDDSKNESGIVSESKNALVFSISDGSKNSRINLLTSNDNSVSQGFSIINGVKVSLKYGLLAHKLPFSITLNDFQLERYPGSNSPSSYASEILVHDNENNTVLPFRIFMNNILQYKGYRFFQSSYDQDEEGTVLSVTNDYWGTLITYIGYFLLLLGVILTFFNKNSRFRTVLKLSADLQKNRNKKKLLSLILLFALSTTSSFAAEYSKKNHFESLNSLLIQDAAQGRIEPFNTFASDVLRKISRKDLYNQMNATELVIRMLADPETWQNEPIIKVADNKLASELGAVGNYLAYNQLFDFDNGGQYRLSEKVENIYHKNQTDRTKYDKEVLNLDERINICSEIFSGQLLNIFPDKTGLKWNSINIVENNTDHLSDNQEMMTMPPKGMGGMSDDEINSIMNKNDIHSEKVNPNKDLLLKYLNAINEGVNGKGWQQSEELLQTIKNIQTKYASEIIPSKTKIQLEIIYNNINIFSKLAIAYIIAGLLLLFFHFINIFRTTQNITKVIKLGFLFFLLLFAVYSLGLAARWYISDHAPWSNGYETMIFVGWAAALSGLIFARRSPISLAVTGVLSAIALFVAGMSWMNPEITNLVPVLKSYWLIIHVAIITSSYGFLAMGALLGLLNLTLMIASNNKNTDRLKNSIQEISYVIELSLLIGLLMLTIGCFIGGVWANESWGRYWGWDPKETWALVSILVYSAILHLRNVPKLNNQFVLSSLALVGFSSIIMTFFGVNYYLSGMHSYGQGTAPQIPIILYLIVFLLGLVIYAAYRNTKKQN